LRRRDLAAAIPCTYNIHEELPQEAMSLSFSGGVWERPMSEVTVLIGSAATTLPEGLKQALSRLEEARVLDTVSEWPLLLESLERERPRLLLLERGLWREASPRRLVRISTPSPSTRVIMYSDVVDVSVVGEAIGYGVHGCMPSDSSSLQWSNAIQVVLREDVAMPRKLLAQALTKALDRRRADREPASEATGGAESITERERDVIRCVTSGMSNKEIAKDLGISGATVKTHLHHVFAKLKVSRRVLLFPGSKSPH
jgi:two-component system nitrate/nitrite response regulator NarL